RSDSPARMADGDRATFRSLGVRTVLDLRSAAEAGRHGRLTGDDLTCHRIEVPGGLGWEHYAPRTDLVRFITDPYLRMAQGARALGAALRAAAREPALPLLMHCQVGRDRTGVLSALILALLGAGDDDIAGDYALSAEAEKRFNAWLRATDPAAELPAPHLVA